MTASKWNHFTIEELACKCGCGRMEMDDEFMRHLVMIREFLDFPLSVSSGYRCPDHNAKVSSTGRTGPHTTGKAVDIRIFGDRVLRLIEAALYLNVLDPGYRGGLGLMLHGDVAKRFVHLDTLTSEELGAPRPWVWTYAGDEK